MKILSKFRVAFIFLLLLIFQSSSALAQNQNPPQDTTLPSDVENVKAEASDSEVILSWDIATDNIGVTGYKIYYGTQSVTIDGSNYEFPAISVEDVVTYTATGLENGKTYYFALTAVDGAGNESDNYSVEVSATPQAGLRKASIEDDGKNPELKEIQVENSDELKLIFSEPVVLPLENPEKAFTVKKKSDSTALAVKRAELDPEDEIGSAVILLTDPQAPNTDYELTVGLEIEDHFGNALIKDKGDKLVFKGFGEEPEDEDDEDEEEDDEEEDETLPEVKKVEAKNETSVEVEFSEEVELFEDDPKSNFKIKNKEDNSSLEIVNVSLSEDGKIAYITTKPQANAEYEIEILGIEDTEGNELEETKMIFAGKTGDIIPPEDVTDLIAKLVEGEVNVVELSWKKSKDSAGDLASYHVYKSTDKGETYDKGISVLKNAEETAMKKLKSGKECTFKVTAKDTSKNESLGAIVSILLPETGPELLVLLGISILSGYLYRRRKK